MKSKKILISFVIILFFINILPNSALGFTFPNWSEIQSSASNFLSRGKSNGENYISTSTMSDIFLPMARILLSIGICVLVGATIIMGVKYMMATPEEAAKLKQQLIGLVVSGIVIFGAVGIWTLAYNVFSSIL